jgi:hypothetical protein
MPRTYFRAESISDIGRPEQRDQRSDEPSSQLSNEEPRINQAVSKN